ncbi:MAG: DinB family protein [Planctomycetota bacterium]
MDPLPFERLSEPPGEVRGISVMVRLVDGVGFRYRWATEGLRPQDADFRPGSDSMSLLELLRHVERLMAWVLANLGGEPVAGAALTPAPAGADSEALRLLTLQHLLAIRARLLTLRDPDLAAVRIANSKGAQPFWALINGPLADALTHVGQINAWRRLAGNPTPRADVFRGLPPA